MYICYKIPSLHLNVCESYFFCCKIVIPKTFFYFQKAVVAQDKSVSLDQMKADVRETYDMLELILKKRKFVAGDSMTIADFSIVATLSTTEVYVPMEKEYPRIDEWYAKMRQLPYYSINAKGVEVFKTVFGKLIPKL